MNIFQYVLEKKSTLHHRLGKNDEAIQCFRSNGQWSQIAQCHPGPSVQLAIFFQQDRTICRQTESPYIFVLR